MDPHKTALERAFELVESGNAASIDEIRRILNSEGYFAHQVTGAILLAQLRNLIQEAKK
ncbi:MAG: hypothetical protein ACRD1R_14065 [Acidobacteriota bacterium]